MLAKSLQYTKSSGLLERFGKPSLPRSAGVSLSYASSLSRVANVSRSYSVLTPARMTGSTLAKEYIRRYATGATEEKDITVPGFGDSITEITVVQWAKNKGDQVKMDDVVCSIETDKLSNEIRAPYAGTIVDTYVPSGSTVAIGSKLYRLGPAKEGAAPAAEKPAAPQPAKEAAKPQEAAAPQPAAKPQPAATQAAAPKPAAPAAPAVQPVIADTGARTEKRVPMRSLRKRVAERLKDAQNTYALLTTFNEIDMQEATEMRNKYKDLFVEKHGVKLGFMSAFVKASAQALKENPIVNAVIDGNDIVYRDYVDISCAVASPTGLLVPVLRNVDKLSFAGVERELGNLAKRAREGGITLEEMAGGTFTISNGGVYGSLMGTPIINPPQSAILGMHGINKRPVVINDQITIRPMMYVALTYDHRLLDGKDAVVFLKRVKELVEDPRRLLLEC